MKFKFRSADNHGLLLSILMIVIGLILVLWPGHVMTTAVTILGIALLAGGVISILSWYRGRMKGASYATLAEGILLAVAGVVVLGSPRFLISIFPVFVGIVILINGIIHLARAVLTIVLGLLITFNPFSTMEMLVMAIGFVIIYNGVSNLWIESRYKKL